MITGIKSNIYDFFSFLEAFQRASKGVIFLKVLKDDKTSWFSTGWLITNNLVAIPDFVIPKDVDASYKFKFRFADSDEKDSDLDAILLPGNDNVISDESDNIRILRLPIPFTDRALSLSMESLKGERDVFVLQFNDSKINLKISFGDLVYFDEGIIQYNADTMHGSSGSPVLNGKGQVIGMHTRKHIAPVNKSEQTEKETNSLNQGISLANIFSQLRSFPEWAEIADFHNLANMENAREQANISIEEKIPPVNDTLLLKTALQWYVDPETLLENEKAQLKPFVTDGHPGKWTMILPERQRIISQASSLAELRHSRTIKDSTNIGDEVVDRILEGPPYRLDDVADGHLPYWLQAVRWFDKKIPELPTPASISLLLEQRRTRSRLTALAGPDFKGRKDELGFVRKWCLDKKKGPLLLTGIGGSGKSTLISKFILDQPEKTIFFWLDFDRADLSPDDAQSIIRIIAEQAYVQIKGFEKKDWEQENWEIQAQELGKAIAAAMQPDQPPPIMVMDGFEVAQHVKKYFEIWQVLEHIMFGLPSIKIIVSGRATVTGLQLNNRKAVPLILKGVDPESAKEWLKGGGIVDPQVISKVIDITDAVPLKLELAIKLLKEGGDIDLPERLPHYMVEGYLYQRILDRVIDPLLQPLARDVLIVRKVSVPMLNTVFNDSMPEKLKPEEVFERLMREMSLVNEAQPDSVPLALTGETGVLHLRPEVRLASLKLIEMDDPKRVSLINQRAIEWYELQDIEDVNIRAELIYHFLRCGNIPKADQLWREDCGPLLTDAITEMTVTATKEKKWLKAHLKSSASKINVESWEQDVLGRIKDAMQRGLVRIIPGILEEEDSRSTNSALLIYDALSLIIKGDKSAAEKFLTESKTPVLSAQPGYNALLALLAHLRGDYQKVDSCLMELESHTKAEQSFTVEELLIRSARIRYCVCLDKEIELFKLLFLTENISGSQKDDRKFQLLTPADVTLYRLYDALQINSKFRESASFSSELPTDTDGLEYFKSELNRKRELLTDADIRIPASNPDITEAEKEWTERLKFYGINPAVPVEDELLKKDELLQQLVVGGLRKWMLATNDLYISEALSFLIRDKSNVFANLAIAGSLATLNGEKIRFDLFMGSDNYPGIDRVILNSLRDNVPESLQLKVTGDAIVRAIDMLKLENELRKAHHLIEIYEKANTDKPGNVNYYTFQLESLSLIERPEIYAVLLFILCPDPLEILCKQILSLPNDFEF